MNAPMDMNAPTDVMDMPPEEFQAQEDADAAERARAAADERLISAIRNFEQNAIGAETDDLMTERAAMIDYYMGEKFGDEIAGRSEYVSRDVYDTIEWIKPSLMRIFAGGERVCEFSPQNENDVEGAKQESEFVDYVVQRKNPWFMLAHEWISDCLMTRNAYALGYWDKYETPAIENYRGVTDDQMVMIAMDEEVTIIAHSSYVARMPLDPMVLMQMMSMGLPPPMVTLHDIEVRRRREYGCAKIAILAPEQCLVAKDAKGMSVRSSSFFEYWEDVTISELRADGYDVPDNISDSQGGSVPLSEVEFARDKASDIPNIGVANDNQSGEPSMRKVRKRLVWMRHDYDGDGWAEMRAICAVGDNILHNKEVASIPIACIVPNPLPHRHMGLTIYDAIFDLQEIKSSMLREIFNNVHLSNNGRFGVDKKLVNLDDMAVSRPGGIVRTQGSPHSSIMPFTHPQTAAQGIAVVEYLDGIRQDRGGAMSPMAGADINSIMAQPGTVAQLTTAASQKIELIARVIGEGVKELFSIVHEITLTNATMQEKVRLSGKWVTVDPRTWKRRTDMTLSVGFGLGNRAQQAAAAQALLGLQKEAIGVGMTTPSKVYAGLSEFVKALGYPTAEQFFVEPPADATFPPKADPLVEATKIKEQGDALIQVMKSNTAMAVEEMKQGAENTRSYFETMIKAQNEAQERFVRLISEATERMQEMRLAHAQEKAPVLNVDLGAISESIKNAQESTSRTGEGAAAALKGVSDAAEKLSSAAEKLAKRKKKITAPSGKVYKVEDDD